MRNKSPRVLLALGWYDHRVHEGIANYAQQHGWHLCVDVTKEKVIPWGWQGDGILAWLGAGDDLAAFVTESKLPTVDFSYRRPQLPFPRVLDRSLCRRPARGGIFSRARHDEFHVLQRGGKLVLRRNRPRPLSRP